MHALDLEQLLGLENEGWHALCTGDGAAFYADMMTDDAVMVLVNGMVLDRGAVTASLAEAPPWSSFEISDVRRIAAGQDAAALVYTARAVREGEDPFVALMSSVYRVVDGKPRLVLYQQTSAGA
jgi:hypothetical protein